MLKVLVRAACLVAIIALGNLCKRRGIFKKEDFPIFSYLVLDITLPAAIITNFSKFHFELSMIALAGISLICCILLSAAGWLCFRRDGVQASAFAVINCSGYNISCFTMPFLQTFLSPAAVVAGYIFDAGNMIVGNGGAYGVACSLTQGGKISFSFILKKLFTSVPLMTYLVMLLISSLHLTVPYPILTLADIIGSSNSFLSMLMLGIGFEISLEQRYISAIVKTLVLRYSVSVIFAVLFFYAMPLPLEIRQVMAIAAFSPICAAAVPYTGLWGGDVGLSGAINSCSIVVSTIIITTLLMAMGM